MGRHGNASREQRLDALSEYVMSEGSVRIEDLPARFDVSLMTVHRDIDLLARKGILRKTRGVVSAISSSLYEASTAYRSRLMHVEKRSIAARALELIEPGQSIILDDSTTGMYLANELSGKCPLTVITNFVPVMDELRHVPDLTLLSLGGQYFSWCSAFMGSVTIRALQNLRADVLFMSAPAVSETMTFHQHHEAVQVKEAAFASAQHRVLYVDHTKFASRALHSMIPMREFDVVIVDEGVDAEIVARMRQCDVRVEVAAVVD